MVTADPLDQGRQAFARQDWAEAYARLRAAERAAPVGADDLTLLATAALLLAREEEGCDLYARAHHAYLEHGQVEPAARCAFWAGMVLVNTGRYAQAGGWFGRTARLASSGVEDGVMHGYLQIPAAMEAMRAGELGDALAGFRAAAASGERWRDGDLLALARLGLGCAQVLTGETAIGRALQDEVMVSVTAGEVSAVTSGIVYCQLIQVCRETFDLPRAREWTVALSRWCEQQPDMMLFQGECLINRSYLMLAHGDWDDALAEAERAIERLAEPPGRPQLGLALYQRAEILRTLGRTGQAAADYRRANQLGWDPEPGLALLRLQEGQVDQAAAALRRALEGAEHVVVRGRLLPAVVEVMLAAHDLEAATAAAEELGELAAHRDTPWLEAAAATASGAVRRAGGQRPAALARLRSAWRIWRELRLPYEAARTRVLMGLVYREDGDEDAAELEFDAARWVFTQLGALPDLAQLEAATARTARPAAGLTTREVEVLRLVASGRTNRAIAGELFLSEKTVARHLSNIFAKLDLPSRAAATAYAYEHHLV